MVPNCAKCFIQTVRHLLCNVSKNVTQVVRSFFTLPKKCPYSEFLWPVFPHIRAGYGDILSKSLYSVRIQKNMGQKNSEYGRFLCSVIFDLNRI